MSRREDSTPGEAVRSFVLSGATLMTPVVKGVPRGGVSTMGWLTVAVSSPSLTVFLRDHAVELLKRPNTGRMTEFDG